MYKVSETEKVGIPGGIPGRHHQLPVHQHHVQLPQEHPHLQILDLMVVLLKTFGGHLRRGLDANQDETAESMRSSNFLLPTAGPLIKMWRYVIILLTRMRT